MLGTYAKKCLILKLDAVTKITTMLREAGTLEGILK
jgi:hypothetical protein